MTEPAAGWQRLDMWLWCARVRKHRADCARLVADGRVRINRMPTDKPHARLRIGDVLTLPLRDEVLVWRVLSLAERRGPTTEARALYAELPEAAASCAPTEPAAYRASVDDWVGRGPGMSE